MMQDSKPPGTKHAQHTNHHPSCNLHRQGQIEENWSQWSNQSSRFHEAPALVGQIRSNDFDPFISVMSKWFGNKLATSDRLGKLYIAT